MTGEAAVDIAIASVVSGLSVPPSVRRDAVLVTGPALSGVTSVVSALRTELPEQRFTEQSTDGELPIAVVFVTSATAPLTPADCQLLDSAMAGTDLVAGVVSKIDVHRTWRDVLAANRELTDRRGDRHDPVPWVGVAAAPDLGAPEVGELAELLRTALGAGDLPRRNRLRVWQVWLAGRASQLDREADGDPPGLAALRAQRNEVLRTRRLAKSGQAIALRSRIQRARVQVSGMARNRCAAVRSELQRAAEEGAAEEGAAEEGAAKEGSSDVVTARTRDSFTRQVQLRVWAVAADVDRDCSRYFADVAGELGVAAVTIPAAPAGVAEMPKMPVRSGRLEARLASVVGASFGLGVALTLRRLLSGLAPGWTMAGAIGCVAVGTALALWVVRTRALVHQRSVLDRWIGEVTVCLRAEMEERVANWVLAADVAWSSAVAEQDAIDSAKADEEVAVIDRNIREHGLRRARAGAIRDRELPAITRALAAVRTQLADSWTPAVNDRR